ncbi:cytochrome b/b6 domain-containing protein [Alkalimarinus sediminis]|uniref:Cytochrome b/b6 domain-containing protein n=1 Tax=Alkalimarinus sediminis TaxID=1632866 RepID=A0A9E8HPD1_9ALTE|nr:cytochrome b/b6 domain-containing protein [Alkalimarinus sediminis]UZW76293.1 cytochrome b/b6 domain-containing protein [Alkalimarinus sediminis]
MTNTAKNSPTVPHTSEKEVSVWDPLVRIFHWVLVGAFFTAYITEEDFLTIHSWAGYTVLGLLIFRIIWGVIGTKHARFKDFVFTPKYTIQFLKDTFSLKAKRYLGHNPAGGAMVILLILSLIVTTFSGLMILGIEEAQGPLAPWLSGASHSLGDLFEELHEFFANFTLFLVFVHVAGVLIESMIHGENLIVSMFSGTKRSNKTPK